MHRLKGKTENGLADGLHQQPKACSTVGWGLELEGCIGELIFQHVGTKAGCAAGVRGPRPTVRVQAWPLF